MPPPTRAANPGRPSTLHPQLGCGALNCRYSRRAAAGGGRAGSPSPRAPTHAGRPPRRPPHPLPLAWPSALRTRSPTRPAGQPAAGARRTGQGRNRPVETAIFFCSQTHRRTQDVTRHFRQHAALRHRETESGDCSRFVFLAGVVLMVSGTLDSTVVPIKAKTHTKRETDRERERGGGRGEREREGEMGRGRKNKNKGLGD